MLFVGQRRELSKSGIRLLKDAGKEFKIGEQFCRSGHPIIVVGRTEETNDRGFREIDIAVPEQGSFNIAELIECEQRMVTSLPERGKVHITKVSNLAHCLTPSRNRTAGIFCVLYGACGWGNKLLRNLLVEICWRSLR